MTLIQARRRLLMAAKKGILPSAYQQVEYIESTGTQYIDTGIKPYFNNTTKKGTTVSVRYQLLANKGSFILGCREGTINKNFTHNLTSAGKIIWQWQTGGATNISTLTLDDYNTNINDAFFNCRKYEWNGVSGNVYNADFSYDLSIYLFACNQAGKANLPSVMRLFKCDIDDKIFIPCYRKSDGAIGLYEKANDIFYENAGTGTFKKGGDI